MQCTGKEFGEAGGRAQSPCTSILLFNRPFLAPPRPLANARAPERKEATKGLLLELKRLQKCMGFFAFPDNAQLRKLSDITKE